MTIVRELVTKLSLGGDALKALGGLDGKVEQLKRAFNNLAAVVTGLRKVFVDWVGELATAGDEIAKSAKNIGITAEAMQELTFAAEQSGASMKDVQVSIARMGKGLNDARRTGTGPFADSLKQLGLNVEDLEGLAPDELFAKLSGELKNVEDESTKAALAQDLFGRGGKRLIPLINEGASGIAALREEFRELGGGFTNDGAARAEEFIDSQNRLKVVLDSIKIAVAEELFPIFQEMVETVQAWAQENRGLIKLRLKEFFIAVSTRAKEFLPTLISIVTTMGALVEATISAIQAIEEFSPGLGAATVAAGALAIALGGMPGLFAAVGVAAFAAGAAIARAVLDIDGSVTRTEKTLDRLNRKLVQLQAKRDELDNRRQQLLSDTEKEAITRAKNIKEQNAGFGEELTEDVAGERRLTIEGFAIRKEILAQERRSVADAEVVERARAQKEGLTTEETGRRVAGARRRALASGRKNRSKAAAAATAQLRKTGSLSGALKTAADTQASTVATETFGAEDKPKRRGGRGGGGGSKKTQAETDAELLGLIDRAAPGTDLSGIGKGRKTPIAAAPIVTVTVNQFNIQMDVDAPVEVNGVPGTSAEEVAELVREQSSEVLRSEFRSAVEQFKPAEAR